MKELNSKFKFVLGSQSPRRKELLEQLGLIFSVRIPEFDEDVKVDLPVTEVPEYLAEQKAMNLFQTLRENELLITADTLVILGNEILGKPQNEDDAYDKIRALSGKWHEVITGVCLMDNISKKTFSEKTQVHFRELSENEIRYYIKNFNPLDKAGAYGIQEWIGLVAVNEIRGCFFNVIGLPVPKLYEELIYRSNF